MSFTHFSSKTHIKTPPFFFLPFQKKTCPQSTPSFIIMDCFVGRRKSKECESTKGLVEKIRILREEIKGMMCEMEKESKAHERDMLVFAFKEAEWKQERKKFKEEVKRLRKMVEENEGKVREMEDGSLVVFGQKSVKGESPLLGTTAGRRYLVEEMRVDERVVWRDEAVEKWKKLYLAIKTELDDLIQRTHRGDGLYRRAENENTIEELKMEVRSREETIEELKGRLALEEKEEYKMAREIDILR